MTEKDIRKLKERNEILEKRCERYREIMNKEGISYDTILTYFEKGELSLNDARYYCRLCELNESHEKPPLGVVSRSIWDRKRLEELSEAMERYLSAGKKIPSEWAVEYNELCGRWEER